MTFYFRLFSQKPNVCRQFSFPNKCAKTNFFLKKAWMQGLRKQAREA